MGFLFVCTTNTKIPIQKDNHMFKKTVTFHDFADNEVTEDHYFNLNKAELFELEVLAGDGETSLTDTINKVAKGGKPNEIIRLFKTIIEKAYGVRSDDGKRFMKSDEIWEDFSQTEAYSEIYFELVTNAEAAAAFVRGIMPKEIQDRAEIIKAQRELADMTPRERSEAQLQGFKKKEEPAKEEEPLPSAPVQNITPETAAVNTNGLDLGVQLTEDEVKAILAQRESK